MSNQKRMNGSDLGSLFGGKRVSTPKQLPGFKKKSENSDMDSSVSAQEAPHPSNHSDILVSSPVEERIQHDSQESLITAIPSTTETAPAVSVKQAEETVPLAPIQRVEAVEAVVSTQQMGTNTIPLVSEPQQQGTVPLMSEPQEKRVAQQDTMDVSTPVNTPIVQGLKQNIPQHIERPLAVLEQKTVIISDNTTSTQEEITVSVQEKAAPTVQAMEKESTMITSISEPSQTQESTLISTEEKPSPTRIPSSPVVPVPQDVGHQPISVATEPPLINSGATVRSNSETMVRPIHEAPTPPHQGTGPMTVPSSHQQVFYPGYGMGVPSHAVPSYVQQGHYMPANGNFHGNGTYVSGHGMAVASHVTHGNPSSSEFYIPPHLGYTWPQSHPFPFHPARGPEPSQNNFYPSPLFTQPPAESPKSVENVHPSTIHHPGSELSAKSAKTVEPSLTHSEQKTVTVAEKPAPIYTTAVEKKAQASTVVMEQEDAVVAESDEETAPSSAGSSASPTMQEWNGPLGRQMNQFANHQQAKWQEAQDRMRVLARKRQFGFLAPSALLNLMESVAVLWRQETEERMTSKEMFIEGGLMMVETRLQALRSYGFPEDQLQSLEQKMEQIKSVIYPQNSSSRE